MNAPTLMTKSGESGSMCDNGGVVVSCGTP